MKRINIYINETDEEKIKQLAVNYKTSNSDIMRRAIIEYCESHDVINFELNSSDLYDIDTISINDILQNPIHFINNYIHINTLDGQQLFSLYDYQEKLVSILNNYNKVIIKNSRQSGMTSLLNAYALYLLLTIPDTHIVLFKYKLNYGHSSINQIRMMIDNIKSLISQKITISSATTDIITLSNNSSISIASFSSIDRLRGNNIDVLICDDFAYGTDLQYSELIPILKSNINKIIINSTPSIPNLYTKLWTDATTGYNTFYPVKIPYTVNKSHGTDWKLKTISYMGQERFDSEFNGVFMESEFDITNQKRENINGYLGDSYGF